MSLQDHPGKSLDELIEIITKTGTDRYNISRKMAVAHDFYSDKGIEIFAVPAEVNKELDISAEAIQDFYEGALKDRGYSLKIDLVVIYDLEQLELIPIKYDDGIGKDAYKFRYPSRKSDAVLGFIKIT